MSQNTTLPIEQQLTIAEDNSKNKVYSFIIPLPSNCENYRLKLVDSILEIRNVQYVETTDVKTKFERSQLIVKTNPGKYTPQQIFSLSHSVSMCMFITLMKHDIELK